MTDDCRFWNEYNLLTEAGAAHISVSREGHGPQELTRVSWSGGVQLPRYDLQLRQGMNDYLAYAEASWNVLRTNLEDLTPSH